MPQYRASLIVADAGKGLALAEAIEVAIGAEAPVSWFEEAGGWTVSVYWDGERPDIAKAIRAIARANGLRADIGPLPDVDWVTKSLEGLPPIRAGRFVVHGGHDRDKPRANDIAIEIEASQAFGTGHHGTTAGCLETIDRLGKEHRFHAPLDLGTGSGVLAIGMARAWGVPVLASDIDPVAVRVANANARLNHVGSRVVAVTAAGFRHPLLRDGKFDLIVANILAGPLGALAPEMTRHLTPGGTIVLSGLLPEQGRFILARYRSVGLSVRRRLIRNGWLTLVLQG